MRLLLCCAVCAILAGCGEGGKVLPVQDAENKIGQLNAVQAQTGSLKIEKATLLGNQSNDASKEIDVSMHHGKKREIRNLFMVLGYDVQRLKRYQIGRFSIKGMPKGVGVILQKNDIKKLFQHDENA